MKTARSLIASALYLVAIVLFVAAWLIEAERAEEEICESSTNPVDSDQAIR